MDKTVVMVEFSIYGDNFDPNHISKLLDITPSKTYIKGDLIRNGGLTRKETAWCMDTGYEASIDINEQLEKVMLLLEDKVDKLVEIKNNLCLNMLFLIVVKIQNHETPAMYFRKSFIHFASKIDAEIGFDVYLNTHSL